MSKDTEALSRMTAGARSMSNHSTGPSSSRRERSKASVSPSNSLNTESTADLTAESLNKHNSKNRNHQLHHRRHQQEQQQQPQQDDDPNASWRSFEGSVFDQTEVSSVLSDTENFDFDDEDWGENASVTKGRDSTSPSRRTTGPGERKKSSSRHGESSSRQKTRSESSSSKSPMKSPTRRLRSSPAKNDAAAADNDDDGFAVTYQHKDDRASGGGATEISVAKIRSKIQSKLVGSGGGSGGGGGDNSDEEGSVCSKSSVRSSSSFRMQPRTADALINLQVSPRHGVSKMEGSMLGGFQNFVQSDNEEDDDDLEEEMDMGGSFRSLVYSMNDNKASQSQQRRPRPSNLGSQSMRTSRTTGSSRATYGESPSMRSSRTSQLRNSSSHSQGSSCSLSGDQHHGGPPAGRRPVVRRTPSNSSMSTDSSHSSLGSSLQSSLPPAFQASARRQRQAPRRGRTRCVAGQVLQPLAEKTT
jgi:hypothetical protein